MSDGRRPAVSPTSTEVETRSMGVREDTMIINMGPQHPSTHGVLRMVLELEGEMVLGCRPVVGYLHTGIEKNMEYRTWQQGSTFVTRADYLAPFFNELSYCLAVERLMGIEAPPRAQTIRVMVTRAEPDRQPPGVAGDDRARAGRHLDDAVRLPRAGADPGRVRDDHRPADEPRVHPHRRRGHGPPGRGRGPGPRLPRPDAPAASTSTRSCCPATRSGGSAPRASACSRPRTASGSA